MPPTTNFPFILQYTTIFFLDIFLSSFASIFSVYLPSPRGPSRLYLVSAPCFLFHVGSVPLETRKCQENTPVCIPSITFAHATFSAANLASFCGSLQVPVSHRASSLTCNTFLRWWRPPRCHTNARQGAAAVWAVPLCLPQQWQWLIVNVFTVHLHNYCCILGP